MDSVQSAIAQAPGVVGVNAKHLESGRTFRCSGDTVFFTASVLKLPVLVELYRQVDEGKIDLGRRVELTDGLRAPGGGVLKELGVGSRLTVYDLAVLMTIISDNVATEVLYKMVGRGNLNSTMQRLGLHATRIPMSIRELLANVVGLDSNDPAHTYDVVDKRLSLDERVLDSDGLSEDRSDVSSPDDMSRLLELVYRGEVLSPASRENVLDILKRQQDTSVIPMFLPTGTVVAHKTGKMRGVLGVRCDVGIVFSSSGPYTVAIMAKQVTGDWPSIDRSLAAVSRAVYDELTG